VSTIKPIILLADSQLLFWRDEEGPFLGRARALLEEDEGIAGRAPKAAYLGASNGDAPEFYDLFVAAMEQISIRDCRQIPAQPAAPDLEFLAAADLILLAGGDVERGWKAFKEAGLDQKLIERYYGGALLVGVSAGAVQLGLKGWDDAGERALDMLRVVPFVVDVHDEPSWGRLLRAVPKAGEHGRGLGIPSGGGALYHPDYSVEPVRHPLVEVSQTENGVRQALLLPGEVSEPGEPPQPAEAAAAAPSAAGDQAASTAGGQNGGTPAGKATSAAGGQVSGAAGDQAASAGGGQPSSAGGDQAERAHGSQAPGATGDQATGATGGQATGATGGQATGAAGDEGGQTPGAAGGDLAPGTAGQPGGGRRANAQPEEVERQRRDLGYSIRPDGIIELHRPDDPDESVN
jgi:hypothetical protein